VQLPGDELLFGEAVDIDADGRLLVRDSADGSVQAVAAGDVTHLRYE
jgi:BirA family biotin operon repressor/biotin-[acetyl-CoA-carboxylase] ligase